MNSTSLNRLEQTTSAQLLTFPTAAHELFNDNLEHLKALEVEATLILACTWLKRNRNSQKDEEAGFVPAFPLLSVDATHSEAVATLERISSENRQRERATLAVGRTLNFITFCDEWLLDSFEQQIVMLLLMQNIAPDFISIFGGCKFEKGRGNGMEIGTLLSMLCTDLARQLECRRYFSVVAPLFKNEIVALYNGIDDTTNILDEKIYLPDRLVRFILGDNNLYNSCFKYIKREKGTVHLDQVILPGNVKQEVASCVENYLEGRANGELEVLDSFYGYGTGLTMLFHGPSGTGKTMLARALATQFGRDIFSLTAEDMREMPGSYDEILNTLFREAALQGAIVFMDECDDMFGDGGRASRALLLELEKARCLVILATNKPVDLDPAIERRISLKVPFGIPDAQVREEIWKALIPETVTLAEDVDLTELALRYQFSGGLIRNTIFLALNLLTAKPGQQKILNRDLLEQAAAKQVATMADGQQICNHYSPTTSTHQLPLKQRQLTELKNLAEAYLSLKERQTGMALVISASSIASAVQAASAVAYECGLKVRSFDYDKVISLSQEDRIIDPVTQRKVLPIDYAFAPTATEASMTIFIDHEGLLESLLNQNKEKMGDLLQRELFARLRKNKGLFCMVTKEMGHVSLPPEFNLLVRLEQPGEELQMRHWEKLMGQLSPEEERQLLCLVEDHPLHLSEIDFIARQAGIMSTIRRRSARPDISDLYEVISGYSRVKQVPLLFGSQEELS